MRRAIAESYKLAPVYHCPIWLCGHIEISEKAMIEYLINDHTNEDYWNEKKEDKIWNGS